MSKGKQRHLLYDLKRENFLCKTRFIKKIIPLYVKTGLDLDPSDKDKINQCITVKKIDFEKLKEIDINQLWGEVMHLLCSNKYVHYLNNDEMKMLNESNDEFLPMGNMQIMVEDGFNWESPRKEWYWTSSSEIARAFNLKSTKGLKSVIEFYGATFIKKGGIRGYVCPKLIRI